MLYIREIKGKYHSNAEHVTTTMVIWRESLRVSGHQKVVRNV